MIPVVGRSYKAGAGRFRKETITTKCVSSMPLCQALLVGIKSSNKPEKDPALTELI